VSAVFVPSLAPNFEINSARPDQTRPVFHQATPPHKLRLVEQPSVDIAIIPRYDDPTVSGNIKTVVPSRSKFKTSSDYIILVACEK
jgi:hypothetical protein